MMSAEAARVGEELRDARLAVGVTLDEVADRLRINRRYLAALEEGRTKDLPGPAYALGFVRTYARALGLDSDELARRYRDTGAVTAKGKADLVFPEPVPERGMPAGVVILLGAVIMVGAYVAWWNWSGAGNRTVDAVPNPPPRIEQAARDASVPGPLPDTAPVLPPTLGAATPGAGAGRPGVTPPPPGAPAQPAGSRPVPPVAQALPPAPSPSTAVAPSPGGTVPAPAAPTAPAAPAAPAPAPAAATGPSADAPSRVTLRASEEAWVQVRERSTGRVILNRVLRSGESYAIPPQEGLVFSTGRAQGLEVVVDGQPTGIFTGRVGVVRDVAVNPEALKAARPAAGGAAPAPAPAR
ncbi:helix-turn-helix domain-containing protein [Muricoccus radiodurans]|uniref:helix-turn-helix domain-containing protein n=1 Tax=Muricoccus radiodurans TaxID=2231721 RepID=UPI003CECD3E4